MVTYRKGDVVRLLKKWDDKRDVGALATVLVDYPGVDETYLQISWHSGANGRYYYSKDFEPVGGPW